MILLLFGQFLFLFAPRILLGEFAASSGIGGLGSGSAFVHLGSGSISAVVGRAADFVLVGIVVLERLASLVVGTLASGGSRFAIGFLAVIGILQRIPQRAGSPQRISFVLFAPSRGGRIVVVVPRARRSNGMAASRPRFAKLELGTGQLLAAGVARLVFGVVGGIRGFGHVLHFGHLFFCPFAFPFFVDPVR